MEITKHLGAISFVILAIGLSLIPIIWPYDVKHTFSQHVGRYKSATIYFILLFTIFIPIFLFFFLDWFAPHLGIPLAITLSVILSALLQYACVFISETHGWRRELHRALTGASAFLLIPTVVFLALTRSLLLQVIVTCCLIVMIIMPVVFLHPRFNQFGESYVIQIIYYLAFFVPVLSATYLG